MLALSQMLLCKVFVILLDDKPLYLFIPLMALTRMTKTLGWWGQGGGGIGGNIFVFKLSEVSLLACVLMCFTGLVKVRQVCILHTLNRTFCDGVDDVFYRFDESETGVYRTHSEQDILECGLQGATRLWIGKDYVNFIHKDFVGLENPFEGLFCQIKRSSIAFFS